MTDQELKDLVASNAASIKELRKSQDVSIKELRKSQDISIKELRKSQDISIKELRKSQDISFKELRKMQEETSKQIQDLKKVQKETSKQLNKTEKQVDKTSKQLNKTIKKLDWMWVTQWEITEEIIYWWFENVMLKRWKSLKRVQRNLQIPWKIEIDILWVNWNEVFVTEVKTRLNIWHIDKFVNKWLVKFRKYFPEYWNYKLYWVMWWRSVPEKSKIYAEKQGLLLIQEDAKWRTKIVNTKDFKPVEFLI